MGVFTWIICGALIGGAAGVLMGIGDRRGFALNVATGIAGAQERDGRTDAAEQIVAQAVLRAVMADLQHIDVELAGVVLRGSNHDGSQSACALTQAIDAPQT